ncbi:MAG: hypothetical protein HON53_09520 [Planctomycetaceae bacterium]|jgi:hypothetical protein|nr:hypothetical protein [Planctomycetaceae bacterium]MBT6153445.1 hypothetical protein [Planctomycetaceae bacterium]MBT6484723.1 hypothetical protein [Planctomycetaceae bacterium]MBT6496473.1 hypothetical protein [Planctomycetaceae bacterium]
MNGSPRLSLNKKDAFSVLRGALLAGGGAIVVYLSTQVLPNLDDSTVIGAVIAGVGSTVLNAIRKYLADTR